MPFIFLWVSVILLGQVREHHDIVSGAPNLLEQRTTGLAKSYLGLVPPVRRPQGGCWEHPTHKHCTVRQKK